MADERPKDELGKSPHDSEFIKAAASARLEIENAITLLKANHAHLTEGQIKEIKRLIYSSPNA